MEGQTENDWKRTITGFYFALCLLSFCLGDLYTFLSHCQVCEAPRATLSGTQEVARHADPAVPPGPSKKMSGGICVKAIRCPQGSLTCHAPISSLGLPRRVGRPVNEKTKFKL